jgi:hypothetical protein
VGHAVPQPCEEDLVRGLVGRPASPSGAMEAGISVARYGDSVSEGLALTES